MNQGKRRILIVEDEPDILKTINKRLALSGFEVLTAADGQEALTTVQQERPELIILDIMLPKLNGYEVCAKLRQDVTLKHIPIIMFTAKGETQAQLAGIMFGADAYVPKTTGFEQLLEQIKSLLPAASG